MMTLVTSAADDPPDPTAGENPWRGRRYFKLVALLGSLTAIGPLTIDSYLPAFPMLVTDLPATESQVQATITGVLLGMGLGQLVIGPVSDTIGRRKPLILGLLAHVVVSLLIALTSSIEVMIGLRVLQGLAGAAVAVVVMAIIRDLFSGIKAVELLSRMALVIGLGPIVAPNIGGLLLGIGSWHLIFVFLAVMGAVLLALGWRALPETLAPERRLQGGLQAALGAYRTVLSDRRFLAMLAVASTGSVTLFSYIAGSAFVLQDGFGLTPQQFALVFSVTGLGIVVLSQINPTAARIFGMYRVLTFSVIATMAASIAMVVLAWTQTGGVWGFLVPVFVIIPMLGFNMSNTTALAVENHARTAGTANALLGAGRFAIAGAAAPLVGVFSDGTAAPLGLMLVVANGIGLAFLFFLRKSA